MVARFLLAAGLLVEAAPGGDVGLVTDDRIDAGRLRRGIELEGPVEIAVVGDRQGIHPQLLRPVDQPFDRTGPVEEAVVAVAVEMDEGAGGHPWPRRKGRWGPAIGGGTAAPGIGTGGRRESGLYRAGNPLSHPPETAVTPPAGPSSGV